MQTQFPSYECNVLPAIQLKISFLFAFSLLLTLFFGRYLQLTVQES